MPEVDEIDTKKVKELIDRENATVLDVRDAVSFGQAHIQGGRYR